METDLEFVRKTREMYESDTPFHPDMERLLRLAEIAAQEDQRSEAERIADSRSKSSTQSSDHPTPIEQGGEFRYKVTAIWDDKTTVHEGVYKGGK